MNGIREFLQSTGGKITAGILILVALGLIAWSFKSNFGDSAIAAQSKTRMMVDSETNQSFQTEIKLGMTFPIKSPYSGKLTGYPADETCDWTADGHVSNTTTYVLMNKTKGLPGATFCPVCHRRVVRNNPPAQEGKKPPPTEEEYIRLHPGRHTAVED